MAKPARPECRLEKQSRADWDRLLFDLLHSLSQPLSTLHCWLEFTAKNKSLPPSVQDQVRQAVECVDRISWPIALIRGMMDTPETKGVEKVRLCELLETLVLELEPVAECCGVSLQFRSIASATVEFPKGKAREILFQVLESAIGCAHTEDRVAITVRNSKHLIIMSIVVLRKELRASISRQLSWEEKRREFLRRATICRALHIVELVGGHICSSDGPVARKVTIALPRVH